jgi:hypothetical protein
MAEIVEPNLTDARRCQDGNEIAMVEIIEIKDASIRR